MKRKLEPVISNEVKAIHNKLETGGSLTAKERRLEVSRDEAAYLLSALAGRTIEPVYIKQLTRGEKPRLIPVRAVGNTYLYRVESLLQVRFTRPHAQPPSATEHSSS
jgi:hypothetical protein